MGSGEERFVESPICNPPHGRSAHGPSAKSSIRSNFNEKVLGHDVMIAMKKARANILRKQLIKFADTGRLEQRL